VDIYVNSRASGVRLVQYVTAGATILLVLVGYTEGAPELAPIAAGIGVACLAGFERFYIRNQITCVSRDSSGWLMHTVSTFGERPVRFEASQARLGGEVRRQTLYGETNVYYPFHVAGRCYIVDATPPAAVDVAAFNQHFHG
jgi:hypothetical protein